MEKNQDFWSLQRIFALLLALCVLIALLAILFNWWHLPSLPTIISMIIGGIAAWLLWASGDASADSAHSTVSTLKSGDGDTSALESQIAELQAKVASKSAENEDLTSQLKACSTEQQSLRKQLQAAGSSSGSAAKAASVTKTASVAKPKATTADKPKAAPAAKAKSAASAASSKVASNNDEDFVGDAGADDGWVTVDGERIKIPDEKPAILLNDPIAGHPADDLKVIKGVGPKLEGVLNELGVYYYKQVANFKGSDIAWVDTRLKFKGRIERDSWVTQAQGLHKDKYGSSHLDS